MNLPANAGGKGSIPGPEETLEEGKATHSSILALISHEQRSLVGYSPCGCKELDRTEQLSTHLSGKNSMLILPFLIKLYHPATYQHMRRHLP